MEPPVVRAVATRLGQRAAAQAFEDRVAHGINAVAAHHALGAVEVDLVELAGVEDACDMVREVGGERRVGLRVEGDVTLLQIVGAFASGVNGRLGFESATYAL